jgi:hypothetical protein
MHTDGALRRFERMAIVASASTHISQLVPQGSTQHRALALGTPQEHSDGLHIQCLLYRPRGQKQ